MKALFDVQQPVAIKREPTCSFEIYDTTEYEEHKQAILKRLESYMLDNSLVSFNDEKNIISFHYLIPLEVAYIFNLGITSYDKQAMLMQKLWMKDKIGETQNHFMKNKLNEMTKNSQDYSYHYMNNLTHLDKENQPFSKITLSQPPKTIKETVDALKNQGIEVKNLIISENHFCSDSKKAFLDKETLGLLKQNKVVVLLEHLCSESMQSELNSCVEKGILSPLLQQYLQTLDTCHQLPKKYGFMNLVKTLVENGIPVFAADSQASYGQGSMEEHSDRVTENRQMINIEWKRKNDEIRKLHPESLIISLVGAGHTSIHMKSQKKYNSFDVIGYDEMINGVHWPMHSPENQCTLFCNNSAADFMPTNQCDTKTFPPLTSDCYFTNHLMKDNTKWLISLMKKNSGFASTEEQNVCLTSIKQYAENIRTSDKVFSIGRIPTEVISIFCQNLGINEDNLIKEPSRYKGKDPFKKPIEHTLIKIKQEDMNTLLSRPFIKSDIMSIDSSISSLYNPTGVSYQNRR